MATLIILINLVIASIFGGNSVRIIHQGPQAATISGTTSSQNFRSVRITVQRSNPIILEGEY
jgi:hypothetical protein